MSTLSILVYSTPSDVVRGWIGSATLQGHAEDLVQRMAGAVGGDVRDIHALASGDLMQLSHMCDDGIVGRMASAVGAHPLALTFRSAMYGDEEDEEDKAVAAGNPDEDEDGQPDPADDEPEPAVQSYRFVMSDANADRADDIVSQGWDLSEFRLNPVAPYNHDYSALPVGKWRNVGVSAGVLRGTLIPTPSPHYPMSMAVADMLAAGSLRTVSVGFRPRSVIARASLPEDDPMFAPRGYVYVSPRLMECSPTTMPMNPRAARQIGKEEAAVQRSAPEWAPFLAEPWSPPWLGH